MHDNKVRFGGLCHYFHKNYSIFDRELTTVLAALQHFCFVLEGRDFFIVTDHTPLMAAFARVLQPWLARQHWYLAYITEFTSYIRHTPRIDVAAVDMLSFTTGSASSGCPPPSLLTVVCNSPSPFGPPCARCSVFPISRPLRTSLRPTPLLRACIATLRMPCVYMLLLPTGIITCRGPC
jgi:RNase H-like domain found in reverse transcriptase